MFKETMEKIGEPVAPSDIVEDVKHGLEVAAQIGYPVVLRPAYTLGGSGGGIAQNPEQCAEILENGLRPFPCGTGFSRTLYCRLERDRI